MQYILLKSRLVTIIWVQYGFVALLGKFQGFQDILEKSPILSPSSFKNNFIGFNSNTISPFQFNSFVQLSPTLCNPKDCTTPGLPVTNSQGLPKLISIESVIQSKHLILCHPLPSHLQSFPASGSFQISQLFTSGGQSIGVSASTSVLPMNTQG